MQVTEKGQITIPKRLRDASGILPGSRASFVLEGGKIISDVALRSFEQLQAS